MNSTEAYQVIIKQTGRIVYALLAQEIVGDPEQVEQLYNDVVQILEELVERIISTNTALEG